MCLDVQMPSMDGFQVLENLDTPKMPAIVFVTAFDQFAVKAFEVCAVDYLLKPVDDRRFEQALKRVKASIASPALTEDDARLTKLLTERSGDVEYPSRLLIRTNSRVLFLSVDDIDYIEAEDYYVGLHVGAKTHLLREPMSVLETRLDPRRFLRIHRSVIVNIGRIKELRTLPSGGHSVHLTDGKALRLSRSRWTQVKEILAQTG
jgi:two-component system LytT family response regulator